jgi:hypothetical protein
MGCYDVRVETTTGVVLAQRDGMVGPLRGAGAGDMLRAMVWQAVHPGEKVHLIVHDGITGEHVLTRQLTPRR